MPPAPRCGDPARLPASARLPARVLVEVGDATAGIRFDGARGLKASAGEAPVTRASGKKSRIGRRTVGNDRLLRAAPGEGAHYRARREHGAGHATAQRRLLNRLLGRLHPGLQHHERFDEHTAFPAPARTAVAGRPVAPLTGSPAPLRLLTPR
ncbi:transposase [Kitasatospora sp. NPDC054939]